MHTQILKRQLLLATAILIGIAMVLIISIGSLSIVLAQWEPSLAPMYYGPTHELLSNIKCLHLQHGCWMSSVGG
ncbi:MAG: hypothetical protein MI924_04580 [Chloroflexales bacterium]|nr:hypothetical protein [Chloroflexales bacterium]